MYYPTGTIAEFNLIDERASYGGVTSSVSNPSSSEGLEPTATSHNGERVDEGGGLKISFRNHLLTHKALPRFRNGGSRASSVEEDRRQRRSN